MEKLTKALMTDETGQEIVSKLTALSGQMHELAMATRGSAILFESESAIAVLGDGGYLGVYVGSTNPLVISGWTGDNSLVTGHLYYLIKSGTAVASSDLGEYGGTSVTDTTLSVSGAPADAKAVGDALAEKADADDVTAVEGDILELQDGGYVADQQKITEKINDWLEEHPEATTTVQDGAVTEVKLSGALKLKTIKDYVTPEMFGAVGDGITDDTVAIQNAINSGYIVQFNKKTYFTKGNIVVSNLSSKVIHGNCAKLLVESSESKISCFAFVDLSDIEIKDLAFESTRDKTESAPAGHTRVSSYGSNVLGISFRNCSNIVIKNLSFKNMASDLWFQLKPQGTTINDNILIDGWYSRNASMPAYMSKVTNINIKNADLRPAVDMGSGDHLLYFSEATDNVYISDCLFDVADANFGYAITAHTSGSGVPQDYTRQPKNIYMENVVMLFMGALWSSITMYHITNCRFKQSYGSSGSGRVLFGGEGLLEMRNSVVEMAFSSMTVLSNTALGVDLKQCDISYPDTTALPVFSNAGITKMLNCHVRNAFLFYAYNGHDDLYAIFENNLVELDNKLTCFVSRRGNTKGIIKLYNNILIGKASDKTSWVIFNSTTSDMTGISCYGNIVNNVTGFAKGSTQENGVFINNYLNDSLVVVS